MFFLFLAMFSAHSVWADLISCVSQNLSAEPTAIEVAKNQAEAAGLHYKNPGGPGITRRMESITAKNKKGEDIEKKIPHYFDPSGREITDEAEINRINALHIPPGYPDDGVWISPDPRSHIQALAKDDRGRPQYRYHSDWLALRSAGKFDRAGEFGEALARIRAGVNRDLDSPGPSRSKVLAAITRLLDRARVRVGSERYAEENETYGLTTLLKKDVTIDGDSIAFDFVGKSDVPHHFKIVNPQVAGALREIRDLDGPNLMQYRDENGAIRKITAADVNDYLRNLSGGRFSAKDFRTWAGSTLAVKYLLERGPAKNGKELKKAVSDAVKFVSGELRNEPATAKKNYIDPDVFKAYEDGRIEKLKGENWNPAPGLSLEETLYLKLR